MGTLLRGCRAPPVQQLTRSSCRVCGVRSMKVQLLPSSHSTELDMTGANMSVLYSMTPSLPPVLPCNLEAAWPSGGASSRLHVSGCASSSPSTSAAEGCPTVGRIAAALPAADAAQIIWVSKGPQQRQPEVWCMTTLSVARLTLQVHMAPWRGWASSNCEAEAARCGGARGVNGALGV
jgi:hypothetical protein